MDRLNPIPNDVLSFAYALNKHCSPTCIAGSSALVKYLTDTACFSMPKEDMTPGMRRVTKSIIHRDIDIFMHANPYELQRFRTKKMDAAEHAHIKDVEGHTRMHYGKGVYGRGIDMDSPYEPEQCTEAIL